MAANKGYSTSVIYPACAKGEETFSKKIHLTNMGTRIKTDFLFAQPSFVSGAARVVDLWGNFDEYNSSENIEIADAKAISSDWLMVGQDLYDAIEQVEAESEEAA